jgi:hypothetical protein
MKERKAQAVRKKKSTFGPAATAAVARYQKLKRRSDFQLFWGNNFDESYECENSKEQSRAP